VAEGDTNVIVTSYNRNFPKRNDGLASTLAFVTSPETVVALALAGRVDFDPRTDTLPAPDGSEVRLEVGPGDELPAAGFASGDAGFLAPPADRDAVAVAVSPTSERLQLLESFPAWDGQDLVGLPVLVKAQGKCTTDHISAAGRWLRFRGHLENISGNLFLGAVNAHTGETGVGLDVLDGTTKPFPDIAAHYHREGQPWVAVGDENYGEGSSREHAAMEPRFRGCRAVLSRSFARIAETNLKKQGVLPLVFSSPETYDQIGETDRISILGLAALAPDAPVRCRIDRSDGTSVEFTAEHTMSAQQIDWFRAGSALNIIREAGTAT
jgi:aconitate hydratase